MRALYCGGKCRQRTGDDREKESKNRSAFSGRFCFQDLEHSQLPIHEHLKKPT
jgi:hypothetical protein